MKLLIKKYVLVLLLFSVAISWAQKQEKLKERFTVKDDVEIEVDTRYTDVVFETWNKDEVVVEAYVEGEDMTAEELNKAAFHWGVEVTGNSGKISIRSTGGYGGGLHDIPIGDLDQVIAGSIGIVEPIMEGLVGPLMEGLTGSPLPPEYYEELNKIEFDHEAYRKEGRDYLKRYEKVIEKSFGPDFDKAMEQWEENIEKNFDEGNFAAFGSLKDIPQWPYGASGSMHFNSDEYEKDKKAYVNKLNKKYGTSVTVKETDAWLEAIENWGENFGEEMEEWGENFGRNFEAWGEQFGKSMEAWGENFGENLEKSMEDWGENFGEDMEKWGEDFGKRMEKWVEEHEGDWEHVTEEDENGNKRTHIRLNYDSDNAGSSKVKRKIKVKMPKNAELDLNVRHGKVKMAATYNAKISIQHGSLVATTIDGGDTSIDVAYSPIHVNLWNEGELTTNHVKECVINTVNNLVLDSSSSNVILNALNGSAALSGSFGQLSVSKMGPDFGTLNVVLENSEMVLTLPESAFNFSLSGNRNDVFVPNSLETKSMKTGNAEIINGYHKSRNTANVITISAKYSDIVLK